MIDELRHALSLVKGIAGIAWERNGLDMTVWVVADAPVDEVSGEVFDTGVAFAQKYSNINWAFLLVAADDPYIAAVWGAKQAPNVEPVEREEKCPTIASGQ